MQANKTCCLVVENLPVPLDGRVWQEARTLRDAGWTVYVVCPATDKFPLAYEELEGIKIYRHPQPLEAEGFGGFLLEYGSALFHEFRLLAKIRRQTRIDVIQVCNPPDMLFLAALPFKLLGAKLVYDLHDLCPELYFVKFNKRGLLYKAMLLFERLTVAISDHVVTANQTFADIVLARDGARPEKVTTMYRFPLPAFFERSKPHAAAAPDKELVIGYMGVMNAQDGVDNFLEAVAHIRRTDPDLKFKARLVGDGPSRPELERLVVDLGISDVVEMMGYLHGDAFTEALASFDIGVIPDPYNEFNDTISMIKVFEYMAMGIPMVSFPLAETMRLAGDTLTVASANTSDALGDAIHLLASNDDLRVEKALQSRAHAEEKFVWDRQAAKYIGVFENLLPSRPPQQIGAPETIES
jgi:glycosyltransferase involved in cell wall biosynthesis